MSKIETYVQYLEDIAADDSHGYSQDKRYSPDYDCSSFVAAGLIYAGFNVSKFSTTRNLKEQLLKNGWKIIDVNAPRVRGDILLKESVHVVTCTDSENIVHASINEKGGITGGQTGDQTGKEICVMPYNNLGMVFDYHFRYSEMTDNKTPFVSAFIVGNVYTLVYNLCVRTGPAKTYRLKNHDELSADGQKHDTDKNGCLDAGTDVTVLAVTLDADGNIWVQIPSGWICAEENGEKYIL